MGDLVNLVERLGYPAAVSLWLMWLVSAFAGRIQRLVEWAIAAKHQLNHIELMLQQLTTTTTTHQQQETEVQNDA